MCILFCLERDKAFFAIKHHSVYLKNIKAEVKTASCGGKTEKNI